MGQDHRLDNLSTDLGVELGCPFELNSSLREVPRFRIKWTYPFNLVYVAIYEFVVALDSGNSGDTNISPAISRIKSVMKERGMYQKDLSKALKDEFGDGGGLSPGAVSQLFKGGITFREHHARRIAKVLNINEEELCSLVKKRMSDEEKLLDAYKNSVRFYFRKVSGGYGSIPVPNLPEDPSKAVIVLTTMARHLEDEGYDLI